jgi:hypothetical protein
MLIDFISRLVYHRANQEYELMRRQTMSDGARFATEGRWVGH